MPYIVCVECERSFEVYRVGGPGRPRQYCSVKCRRTRSDRLKRWSREDAIYEVGKSLGKAVWPTPPR